LEEYFRQKQKVKYVLGIRVAEKVLGRNRKIVRRDFNNASELECFGEEIVSWDI